MKGSSPAWVLATCSVMLVAKGIVFDASSAAATSPAATVSLDVHDWRIIAGRSGKVNYYRVIEDRGEPFIRAEYRPPYDSAVLGFRMSADDRERARTLRWSWRAVKLPDGGNECARGKGDSAAVVYVTWKRFLRYYTIKYVWSGVGTKGAICDRKRSPFVAQDTVIIESGGPLGAWRQAAIDLRSEWRSHFGEGDPHAAVPTLLGVGIMSDGDQTRSESIADYRGFEIGF